MPTAENPQRATPREIKDFFSVPGRPVSLGEIKDLKADPKDYDAIADGIGNGTLTY